MKHALALISITFVTYIGIDCLSVSAKSRAAVKDDIREAVFRYQLHPPEVRIDLKKYPKPRLPSGKEPYTPLIKVFFLETENGTDPSGAFMKRFAGHRPPVKKVSQSQRNPKPDPEHDID